MNQVLVKASKEYYIDIEEGLFNNLEQEIKKVYDGHHLYVITDSNVAAIYLDKMIEMLPNYEVMSVVIPDGEESKSFDTYQSVLKQLLDLEISRKEMLVALGGGVVGDLTGFVAATLFRGLPFIQIPTTLISMVDSSIGGKTAIDFLGHKNLVGAFNQPELVVIDPLFLKTLPIKELKAGYGEVIKHALIRSEELFKKLEGLNDVAEINSNILLDNILIKKEVVERDEFDNNERMILNFGHTFGHIIEMNYGYNHGEAVLSGMLCALDMGETFKIGNPDLKQRILNLYKKLELNYLEINYLELLPDVSFDKKNIKGKINFILLPRIARPLIYPLGLDKLCAL